MSGSWTVGSNACRGIQSGIQTAGPGGGAAPIACLGACGARAAIRWCVKVWQRGTGGPYWAEDGQRYAGWGSWQSGSWQTCAREHRGHVQPRRVLNFRQISVPLWCVASEVWVAALLALPADVGHCCGPARKKKKEACERDQALSECLLR